MRIVAGLALASALLTVAAPARAATPICIPEHPVCAGLDDGRFVFTVKPPPTALAVGATVNGAPATGTLSTTTTPAYVQGWFQPFPPLEPGDVICLQFWAPGVPPGPYCDTAR
ncbi:hypothetical protein [Nonomuraea typhae]|uniref:hypothetical protein n=1 Tax=Nonomuraea typhae TaxID=2603600 RepID=UPI0012F82766|nr:hypothetical protein [Nonomuraea typhae]